MPLRSSRKVELCAGRQMQVGFCEIRLRGSPKSLVGKPFMRSLCTLIQFGIYENAEVEGKADEDVY